MADVKPFLCIRPQPELVSRVAALPYDVYNRQEARAEAAKDPLSFLNIDRAETQFPENIDLYADCVYEKARELLDTEIREGVFLKEKEPCYYVYELTMDGRTQTGIAACSAVCEYESGIIRKHENTRAEKEADRIRHVDACDAQTGPIFLAYRARNDIRKITAETKKETPVYDFTSADGIRHRVWRIGPGSRQEALKEAFRQVPNTYIADGHHRAASAVKVSQMRRKSDKTDNKEMPYEHFLSVLFPDEELMIMDYNRVVRDLNGMDAETFLQRVSEVFTVEAVGAECCHPKQKGEFGMYLDGQWYCLKTLRTPVQDPVADLDVSVLQDTLLAPILGIGDPRTDARIDFVGGIRGLKELERRCRTDMRIAFSMYPTSIAELFEVADASRLMPPKSTWFEPKLRSGIFIHRLSD